MSQESQERRTSLHGNWSSRLAFILAVTGSAVGLGNIWKFPYIAGENGGGAFVLVYLICILLVGLPIMMSEIMLGRRGRRNPGGTMRLLGEEEGSSKHWGLLGISGIVAGILILSYYSVIAGIALAYVIEAVKGAFVDQDAAGIATIYNEIEGSWSTMAFWHTLFMLFTIVVVARGVKNGLEKAVQFMVPALLFLMFILLINSIMSGGFGQAVSFMFTPDFSKLTPGAILTALGLAFFSLSIGMGAVMAYGAYLPDETSIPRAAAAVVAADTSIAILAGLVIFPIVFANGLSPDQSIGLVFKTLPLAFGGMQGGVILATLFFVLLSFAAWTSAIGLIEPGVAWLIESKNKTRKQASFIIGGSIWVLGFGSLLSFNVLSGDESKFLAGTFYDNIDYLTSNIMLPLGGLFITVFSAWVMSRNSSSSELGGAGTAYKCWRFLARFVAPLAVVIVFLNAIGLF
ncbi:MAG: sodium-dependent transporter [Pseudomonadota bacterium]